MNTFTEQDVERDIQAKGLKAPRITPGHVDRKIVGAKYWQPEGTTVTIALLSLSNGFQVHGYSAAASAENFDKELGEKIAFRNAREKIWQLEGYLLREDLHRLGGLVGADFGSGDFSAVTVHTREQVEPGDWFDRLQAEYSDLLQKIGKLEAFVGTRAWNDLSDDDRFLLSRQSAAMVEYAGILAQRIYNENLRRPVVG